MWILDNPIVAILSLVTSVAFTAVAALVPPNAGNFVAAVFLSSFASFLGGEEVPDDYEAELEDADI
jgi:Mn2+/Fe2+ NRAMP family transporter